MNIVIGLIVFVSVMQTCNDANFEIKYRTLILEAESVQLPVSIIQSIHDDMLLACYDFFFPSRIGTFRSYSPTCHKYTLSLLGFDLLIDKPLLTLVLIKKLKKIM
jgi:hypothetical protein